MLFEALKIAVTGFIVVMATLSILAFSVKIMSYICILFDRKGKGL
ncbi:MAG: hypothetical protein N3D15_09710 [Syntrophorhabdaceae bacterium]|nr:hypothetical protein [Syntrophorhabdaceae bacterium]